MAKQPVPTLAANGWVTTMAEKADLLLSYFFISEKSQSNIYGANIVSLPDMIKQYGNDPSLIQSKMISMLEDYLGRYFDSASVNVTVTTPTSITDSRTTLRLDVAVTDDGVTDSLGRLVSFLNSKIIEIINLNNNQVAP